MQTETVTEPGTGAIMAVVQASDCLPEDVQRRRSNTDNQHGSQTCVGMLVKSCNFECWAKDKNTFLGGRPDAVRRFG